MKDLVETNLTKIALIFVWLMAFGTLIFAIDTRARLINFHNEYVMCVRCELK